MSLLAQRRSGEVRFSEERTVSGLDRPLLSSGTLSFTAPDNFARRTLQPRAESMIVEGQKVTLERGGRVRQVSLDAIPEMAGIVTAMRGTLTGDAAALRQYFRPTVSGSAARWSITLIPLEERLLDSDQAVAHRWRTRRRAQDRDGARRRRPFGDDDRCLECRGRRPAPHDPAVIAGSRLRGRVTLLLWLAALAAGLVVIARSQFSADLTAFLPAAPTPSSVC